MARSLRSPFDAIVQVGVAMSIGFPILMVGFFTLLIAHSSGDTTLWVAGGTMVLLGLIWSSSNRVV